MKLHHFTAGLSGLLLAGVLIAALQQQRALAALRTEVNQRQAATAGESVASLDTTPNTPVSTRPKLSDAEMSDLLTLRRDVAALRARQPDQRKLQAENQRLRNSLANTAKAAAEGSATPESYIKASQAKFIGTAQPADTLQSFLYAARNRDTNALFQILSPETITQVKDQLQRSPKEFFDGMSTLPGFLIKNLVEVNKETMEAELQFDPRSESGTGKLKLKLVNGEWKLSLQ